MLKFGFADPLPRRSFVRVFVLLDGGECSLCKGFAKGVGLALLGWDVAFSGSMGCCGFPHDRQLLECPEEVWAALRAFLLPH